MYLNFKYMFKSLKFHFNRRRDKRMSKFWRERGENRSNGGRDRCRNMSNVKMYNTPKLLSMSRPSWSQTPPSSTPTLDTTERSFHPLWTRRRCLSAPSNIAFIMPDSPPCVYGSSTDENERIERRQRRGRRKGRRQRSNIHLEGQRTMKAAEFEPCENDIVAHNHAVCHLSSTTSSSLPPPRHFPITYARASEDGGRYAPHTGKVGAGKEPSWGSHASHGEYGCRCAFRLCCAGGSLPDNNFIQVSSSFDRTWMPCLPHHYPNPLLSSCTLIKTILYVCTSASENLNIFKYMFKHFGLNLPHSI